MLRFETKLSFHGGEKEMDSKLSLSCQCSERTDKYIWEHRAHSPAGPASLPPPKGSDGQHFQTIQALINYVIFFSKCLRDII